MYPKIKLANSLICFALTVLFSIMCQKSIAQYNNLLDSLINQNLYIIIQSHNQYYKAVCEGERSIKDDFCIFIDNLSEGFEFSDEIRKTEVKYISESNLTDSQLRQGVHGTSISEILLFNNKLILSYNTKGIKLEGNKIITGFADYYRFEYEYSCVDNLWKLVKSYPENL